ncbi:hypothetical protein HB852_07485 [Listeria grandensis]|uniref:hypothetical protein n=1 Tax=Listeria grandensis TaxID=1494963 RepID=UPI00162634C4|nr:hypothetical protein [Listeria grandensis]MBC1474457.1 hypothetical protein [Listeria grandensis]
MLLGLFEQSELQPQYKGERSEQLILKRLFEQSELQPQYKGERSEQLILKRLFEQSELHSNISERLIHPRLLSSKGNRSPPTLQPTIQNKIVFFSHLLFKALTHIRIKGMMYIDIL